MQNLNKELEKSFHFPIEQRLDDLFLKENFWKCLYTSAEEQLHYWIILPNSLKPTSLHKKEIKGLDLTIIGEYTRIDDSPYLEVSVGYEFCKYEMNTSDWLLKKLYIMGEQILNYRVIEGKTTGEYLDVLTYKKMPSGDEVISRFTCLKDFDKERNGANHFCMKASCLKKDYDNLALNIFQIVSNWDLTNKSDWQMAEVLVPFDFDFTEKVLFYYPASWQGGFDKTSNEDCVRVVLTHTIDEENKGIINLFMYPENLFTSANQVQKNALRNIYNLEGVSLDISEMVKIETANPFIKSLFQMEGEIDYSLENFSANIRVYVIQTNSGWYCINLVGPKPNLQNYFWEVNKRTLEIIINSFNNLKMEHSQEYSRIEIPNSKEQSYKVFKGKNYTKEEWIRYEEQQWLKNNNKRK